MRLGYEGGGGRNETEFLFDDFLLFLERESLGREEWERECTAVVEVCFFVFLFFVFFVFLFFCFFCFLILFCFVYFRLFPLL